MVIASVRWCGRNFGLTSTIRMISKMVAYKVGIPNCIRSATGPISDVRTHSLEISCSWTAHTASFLHKPLIFRVFIKESYVVPQHTPQVEVGRIGRLTTLRQINAHRRFHVFVCFVAPGAVIGRFNDSTYRVKNADRPDQLATHLPICEMLRGFVGPFNGGAVIPF